MWSCLSNLSLIITVWGNKTHTICVCVCVYDSRTIHTKQMNKFNNYERVERHVISSVFLFLHSLQSIFKDLRGNSLTLVPLSEFISLGTYFNLLGAEKVTQWELSETCLCKLCKEAACLLWDICGYPQEKEQAGLAWCVSGRWCSFPATEVRLMSSIWLWLLEFA